MHGFSISLFPNTPGATAISFKIPKNGEISKYSVDFGSTD
jgi:hypothetical protein